METVTINLFEFSELSEEAKKKATEEYVQEVLWVNGYDWQEEFRNSIKAAEELFNLTIEEDAWGNFYAYIKGDSEIEKLNFKRAIAYINNHFEFRKANYNYRSTLSKIKERMKVAKQYHFHSIFYNRPALARGRYEDNMPTGYCEDYCIINAYKEFVERAKKAKVLSAVDMRTFLYILCDKFYEAWNNEKNWQESIEAMKERAEVNEWRFEEDGTFWR